MAVGTVSTGIVSPPWRLFRVERCHAEARQLPLPPFKEILFELKHLASYMIASKVFYRKSLPMAQSDKNQVNKEELKREIIG